MKPVLWGRQVENSLRATGMKALGLILALLCAAATGRSADYFVNWGAVGANDGSDWSNAWVDFSFIAWSSIQPGDNIWVAGGTYGELSIGQGGVEGEPIYIARVRTTNAVPANAPGWQAGFDDTVVINGVGCSSQYDYWTLDGQVPYGGIVVTNTGTGEDYVISLDDSGANYVTLENLDVGGAGNVDQVFTGEGRCLSANYSGTGYGLHVAYCQFHNDSTLILSGGQCDVIFEHNRLFSNLVGNPGVWHPNVWASAGGETNVVVRYNDVSNWQDEGIMMNFIAGRSPDSDWFLYGNVWHDSVLAASSRILETQYQTNGPVFVFNNTFKDIAISSFTGNGGTWDPRCAASNNIFFNVYGSTVLTFDTTNHDFNLCDGANDEPNGIAFAPTTIFADYAARDYHISGIIGPVYPRDKGAILGPAYNQDLDGQTRGADGAWDIGAYAFVPGLEYAPEINIQPGSQKVFVGGSVRFEGIAGGSQPLAYQWLKNGIAIAGATDTALSLTDVAYADCGTYVLQVTNSAGVALSDEAVLGVSPLPAFANLTNGLVLHLKFDGDFLDSSGRGNDGVAEGSPTFVPGELGLALHYDTSLELTNAGSVAQASYVALGSPPDLQFGLGNFSISYWVRQPEGFLGGPLPFIGSATNSIGNEGFVCAPSDLTGGWECSLNDGVFSFTLFGAHNSVNDGNWHHLLHVFNRSGWEGVTYLDGVQVAFGPIDGLGSVDTGGPINIGQDPTGGYGQPGEGDLDDVAVWSRALTAAEAFAVYYVGENYGRSFDTYGPVTLIFTNTGEQSILSWQAGTLMEAENPNGPWSVVPGAAAPNYRVSPVASARFYRVRL